MRPEIPSEIPNWGFLFDTDPDRDATVHVIRVRAEKVLRAKEITSPFVEDVRTIFEYTHAWHQKQFGADPVTAPPITRAAWAVGDLERIQLLVHTIATLMSQAAMLMRYEQAVLDDPFRDQSTQQPSWGVTFTAKQLASQACNFSWTAINSCNTIDGRVRK